LLQSLQGIGVRFGLGVLRDKARLVGRAVYP
jgi:hypothetical protein